MSDDIISGVVCKGCGRLTWFLDPITQCPDCGKSLVKVGHNIAVTTLIYRSDGVLFANLGTMCWFAVDDEVRDWLAGSCRTTAGWLVALPETVGESYTLKYRTVVTNGAGKVESDTTMLEFANLSYADVIKFEYWALEQLREMIELFERKHKPRPSESKPRSRIKTVAGLARQYLVNKWRRD